MIVVGLNPHSIKNLQLLIPHFPEFDWQSYTFQPFPRIYYLNKRQIICRELLHFLKIFFKIYFFRNANIFCVAGQYSFLVMNRIFRKILGDQFQLIIYNFYIHAWGNKKIVQKILKFMLNRENITLIVQSPKEVDYYATISKKCRVVFIPYCENDTVIFTDYGTEFDKYIFTGGSTNRDYPLMLECAKCFPQQQFVFIASDLNNRDFQTKIPPNVTLLTNIERSMFYGIMSKSECVIIPLKEDVGASGQMLCLGAIKLKKPIIYCNISSINYYFSNNSGIPYEIGNLNSLSTAIQSFKNKTSDELEEQVNNAYKNYKENYTEESKINMFINILKH
jgi:glycosyltransferase involved in cell wall biosynthesis